MRESFLKATVINFTGILLFMLGFFYLFWADVVNHLDESLIALFLIFPTIAFFITDKYYEKEFWKSFFVSIGLGIVVLIAILAKVLVG